MKSAYELAMERLEKASGPTKKLTDEQKARIAEIEKKYEAKIAEQNLAYESQLAGAGSPEEVDKLRRELAERLTSLEAERDKRKDAIWERAAE